MSTFEVKVMKLDSVEPHPDADRLDLAVLGGYRSVVPKGVYQAGDLVVYVPEGSRMPDWLLEQQGLVGKLATSQKNVVKAIKLRGVLSQGVVVKLVSLNLDIEGCCNHSLDMKMCHPVREGDEVAEILGITKYESPIPLSMSGDLKTLYGVPLKYDIENIKRFPRVLQPDDMVVLTEKLHGTCAQIGWRRDLTPDPELFGNGRVYICSKGLGAQGLVFKNDEANAGNLYVKTLRGLAEALGHYGVAKGHESVTLLGEIFGDVQDLKYGMKQNQVSFRAFDMVVDGQFMAPSDFVWAAIDLGVEQVPELTSGLWSWVEPDLDSYTRGESTLSPGQIREGVVIRLATEREDLRLGRVILKSVSEDYLLRRNKDATELS